MLPAPGTAERGWRDAAGSDMRGGRQPGPPVASEVHVTDSKTSQELRVAKRCPLFVEVEVRDRSGVYFYRARNISSGGVFIDAPVPLEEGTAIDLRFQLPGGEVVAVEGQVIWTTRMAGVPVPYPGMGVAFRNLEPPAHQAIQTYVSSFSGRG